ncbi:MAG TPA: hypothetical protein DD730_07525 [Desulfosporosinus sp.]|jgi:hypothetical protein|nr:hypothetical protein [Desulfosporosinus sp.]
MNQRKDIRTTIDRLLLEFETKAEPHLKLTALLCKSGIDLGKEIRANVEVRRLQLNLGSFMANYDQVASRHWKTSISQCGTDKYCISHRPDAEYCPFSKNLKLGNMLCLLDRAILNGFDPDMEVKVASSMKAASNSYWFDSEITV